MLWSWTANPLAGPVRRGPPVLPYERLFRDAGFGVETTWEIGRIMAVETGRTCVATPGNRPGRLASKRSSALVMRGRLALYARLERPVLRLNYRLVRGVWTRRPLAWLVGRLFLAPLSSMGAVGQPVTLAEAEELVRDAAAGGRLGIGPCGCRTVHRGCAHPTQTDVLIYGGVDAWQRAFPEEYRPAGADEVLDVLRECRRLGMIQVVWRAGMAGGPGYSLCNCCTDGLPAAAEFGASTPDRFDRRPVRRRRGAGCHRPAATACPSAVLGARAAGDAGPVAGCLGCGLCAGCLPGRRRADAPAGESAVGP